MSVETYDIITVDGNLSLLDRTGGRVNLVMTDGVDEEDLSALDIYFECGTVSLEMSDNGTGDKYVDILPEHIDTIIDDGATRFAIIDKTATPDTPLWEGLIFFRSVD
jgi:hypothetical protein